MVAMTKGEELSEVAFFGYWKEMKLSLNSGNPKGLWDRKYIKMVCKRLIL